MKRIQSLTTWIREGKMTTKEEFMSLMEEVVEGWNEVRNYDDDHLYYDRNLWVIKDIKDRHWLTSTTDQYDRNGDLETISILIEQYLRYGEIVKETKIGMLPKVDDIEDENDYILGSGKQDIKEEIDVDSVRLKKGVRELIKYLLKK